MAKKYFWFKMKEDFFKSKEVKKLRKIAGGDTYTIIYQKLIILSLRNEGKLFFDGIEETFAEEIALEIDEEVDNVKATLVFLVKFGLVDQMSDTELVITEAVKNIGTETESAERVRLHRQRKTKLALQCNGHVTKCNTEIDIDLELEKEKKSTMINPLYSDDDRVRKYASIYYQITGNEHRNVKIDFTFNGEEIEGIKTKDIVEYIEENYQSGNEDRCYMEYFNIILGRYK